MSSTSAQISGCSPWPGAIDLELAAHVAAAPRHDQPRLLQVPPQVEGAAVLARWADQAHCLAREQAALPGALAVGADGFVGQHHVQLVQGQAFQQFVHPAGLQGDHQVVSPEEGAQQVLLEVTREGRDGADAQRLAGLAGVLQGGLQLAAEREDGVGVIQHQLPGFGQL
ncbi:hypothetical protein Q3H58_000839 [Pseudomonas psychrotolerans]|nr:hypothetical protein [Pseudomonas psychrotolerans]